MRERTTRRPEVADDGQPAGDHPVEGPRTEHRRAAFLAAAKEVFLEHGYADASMAEIVRRAGGSLATLYQLFGDKRALFVAAVDDRVASLTQQMQMEHEANAPLEEGLARIGRDYLRRMLEPEALDLARLLIGKARSFPDLPRDYLQTGQERVRRPLADYLASRSTAGEITLSDPQDAAAVFLDLLRARLLMRSLIDPDYRATEDEIETAVQRSIRIFRGGAAAL
ncbi:TetR family transcriptional regulator [bacterium]|nr:TetR family transcriptional regulator [bacterium]